MKFSVLIVFLLVLAVANAYPANSITGSKPPRKTKTWFGGLKKAFKKLVQKLYYWNDKCHGLECPEYELINKTDDYQLRCYQNYSWVGTKYLGKFVFPWRM